MITLKGFVHHLVITAPIVPFEQESLFFLIYTVFSVGSTIRVSVFGPWFGNTSYTMFYTELIDFIWSLAQ